MFCDVSDSENSGVINDPTIQLNQEFYPTLVQRRFGGSVEKRWATVTGWYRLESDVSQNWTNSSQKLQCSRILCMVGVITYIWLICMVLMWVNLIHRCGASGYGYLIIHDAWVLHLILRFGQDRKSIKTIAKSCYDAYMYWGPNSHSFQI